MAGDPVRPQSVSLDRPDEGGLAGGWAGAGTVPASAVPQLADQEHGRDHYQGRAWQLGQEGDVVHLFDRIRQLASRVAEEAQRGELASGQELDVKVRCLRYDNQPGEPGTFGESFKCAAFAVHVERQGQEVLALRVTADGRVLLRRPKPGRWRDWSPAGVLPRE